MTRDEFFINVGQRMVSHTHDEAGNAEPVRVGGSMRNIPWQKA